MILGSTAAVTGLQEGSDAVASEAQLQEDLNRFLNLLVAQLKNQDPLDPLDSNEFTSQLVQFASVEQQIKQNANLEKLLNLQETSQVSTMVQFIGNTVEATGNTVPLENGRAEFTYTLDTNASDVTISIRNSAGLTVFTADGETGAGKHGFVWDGTDTIGNAQPDGAYTVTIGALDARGNLLSVDQTVFGRVTGGGVDNGMVSLFMGDVVVSMDDVHLVKESPSAPASAGDTAAAGDTTAAAATAAAADQTQPDPAEATTGV